MATTIEPNTILIEEGQRFKNFTIILDGTVQTDTPFGTFKLEKGDIIGLLDINSPTHSYTYRTLTETVVTHSNYLGPDSLAALLSENKEMYSLCPRSMIKQTTLLLDLIQYLQYESENLYAFLTSTYITYKLQSKANSISFKPLPNFEQIISPAREEHVHPWMINYYAALQDLSSSAQCLFEKSTNLTTGLLLNFSKDAIELLRIGSIIKDYQITLSSFLLNENNLDFFDLYSDLFIRVSKVKDPSVNFIASFNQLVNYLDTSIHINTVYWQSRYKKHEHSLANVNLPVDNSILNESAEKNLAHSFDQILEFSGCDKETCVEFKKLVQKYMTLPDRSDISDESKLLYKEITSHFYNIYTSAFQVSLMNENIPTIIKMFFLFGYIDEGLSGIENAEYLYTIAEKMKSDPVHGIYTFYDWLRAIYDGKKEPSRNEFDVDYTSHIRQLSFSGKIDKATEIKMKNDGAGKVMYELNNMFPLVNKITYGKIINFTPLLSEHNLLRQVQDTLVTTNEVHTAIKQITDIDYSAFCREIIFSDLNVGITREFIQTEILPDIILMPNAGTRGIAWQEIEGKHRDTPARFMLPILSTNDIESILLHLTGEFRWEMCKRIQGTRWNDVSEHSLTSSYFDYVQFYRKNGDLSPDMKNKIKLSLQRTKNNFKEAFVQDYISYVSYEKNGIPKLNKVTRDIFFTYCPFPEVYRNKLDSNPLYKEVLNKHTLHVKRDLHHYDLITKKIAILDKKLPLEIQSQINFLNK